MRLGSERVLVHFATDPGQRRAWLAQREGAALVSDELPMRANLSLIENVALVAQVRSGWSFEVAAQRSLQLLGKAGRAAAAHERDAELSREDRFVAKFIRAVLMATPTIVVDRPSLQLPDTPYPAFIETLTRSLHGEFEQCWILDYEWNARLYALNP